MTGQVPLLSEVQAGDHREVDNFNPGAHPEMVHTRVEVKRHTFAVRVRGDSMTRSDRDSFPEGSVLIVEPEMAALAGDYVIGHDPQSGLVFKQLVKDGGEFFLKPLNPRYPILPLGQTRIIGVVREMANQFR